jgi:hypothetical protein
LISKRRGRSSNRRKPEAVRTKALSVIRERYWDFGPTLAAEKLREVHQITLGRETLRLWMIEAGIWADRKQRRKQVHQPRPRRHGTSASRRTDTAARLQDPTTSRFWEPRRCAQRPVHRDEKKSFAELRHTIKGSVKKRVARLIAQRIKVCANLLRHVVSAEVEDVGDVLHKNGQGLSNAHVV